MPNSRILLGLFLTSTLLACDSADSKPDSKPDAAKADGNATASDRAKQPDAKGDAVQPVAVTDVPTCAQLAEHIHSVLSTTGSARTKENLAPVEQSRADCEKRTQDPELMRCFIAAKDEPAIDECNLKPFVGKQIDGTPKRSFDALQDNSAAVPPVMTEDGDYMGWDAQCGLLYKTVPPAAAVFVTCGGKVEIGPIVNVDVLDEVIKSISDAKRSRHEMVMGIIANRPSGNFSTPYRVYDEQGRYKGIEYR